MSETEYLDCTDQPDPENIRRIINFLSGLENKQGLIALPSEALDALEQLLKIAYPGDEETYHCRVCGDPIQIPRTPGKKPSSLCKKTDCQRQANRERVARYREACRTPSAE